MSGYQGYQQETNARRQKGIRRQQKMKVKADRFVPMDELEIRLGRTKRDIYRQMKKPDFLPIVRSGGKVGCLESALLAYLKSLPRVELSS